MTINIWPVWFIRIDRYSIVLNYDAYFGQIWIWIALILFKLTNYVINCVEWSKLGTYQCLKAKRVKSRTIWTQNGQNRMEAGCGACHQGFHARDAWRDWNFRTWSLLSRRPSHTWGASWDQLQNATSAITFGVTLVRCKEWIIAFTRSIMLVRGLVTRLIQEV